MIQGTLPEVVFDATIIEKYDDTSYRIMPHANDDVAYQDVMIIHTKETEMLGFDTEEVTLNVDDVIEITTNGIMTMSLPPQLNPLQIKRKVPLNSFEGEIKAHEDFLAIAVSEHTGVAVGDIVKVFIDETTEIRDDKSPISVDDLALHDRVYVEHNGMLTRSLPPHLTASLILKR